jgi:hypothetical protein
LNRPAAILVRWRIASPQWQEDGNRKLRLASALSATQLCRRHKLHPTARPRYLISSWTGGVPFRRGPLALMMEVRATLHAQQVADTVKLIKSPESTRMAPNSFARVDRLQSSRPRRFRWRKMPDDRAKQRRRRVPSLSPRCRPRPTRKSTWNQHAIACRCVMLRSDGMVA